MNSTSSHATRRRNHLEPRSCRKQFEDLDFHLMSVQRLDGQAGNIDKQADVQPGKRVAWVMAIKNGQLGQANGQHGWARGQEATAWGGLLREPQSSLPPEPELPTLSAAAQATSCRVPGKSSMALNCQRLNELRGLSIFHSSIWGHRSNHFWDNTFCVYEQVW